MQLVFNILRKQQLVINEKKCTFFRNKIKFLGFTITDHGILPDDDKIEAIKHYNAPTNVKEVRQFIGLASYYRKFIKNFSTIAGIITDLTKDAVSWNWTPDHQSAFEKIKLLLISAPILQLPAFDKQFELHVDACDTGIGGVIMQEGKSILFESRKLNEAEKRYPTHEKELLALVHMLKKWRVYLMGNRVQVLTDNASLTWLMTQKQLSNRQARWLQLIQTYDLDIKYIKGSINLVADALSRRFVESNTFTVNNNDFIQTIKQQLIKDSYFKDIVECINGMCKDDKIKSRSKWFIMKDGLLYLNDKKDLRICIPRSMVVQILHEVHDSPTGGHPGIERTFLTLKQYYFWPEMHNMIKQYITGCESCQLNKVSNMKPQSLLNPIEIPTQRWQVISMDFITDLPKSDKFNMIMVVVDRLTKRVRLIPSCTSATAMDVANLFVDYIFRDFQILEGTDEENRHEGCLVNCLSPADGWYH